MASIDKIYGSNTQYDELYNWLKINNQSALRYLYSRENYVDSNDRMIANFPEHIDAWLLKNCPIQWVLERLHQQYSQSTLDLLQQTY